MKERATRRTDNILSLTIIVIIITVLPGSFLLPVIRVVHLSDIDELKVELGRGGSRVP